MRTLRLSEKITNLEVRSLFAMEMANSRAYNSAENTEASRGRMAVREVPSLTAAAPTSSDALEPSVYIWRFSEYCSSI